MLAKFWDDVSGKKINRGNIVDTYGGTGDEVGMKRNTDWAWETGVLAIRWKQEKQISFEDER